MKKDIHFELPILFLMDKRFNIIMMLFAGLLILVGCEKMSSADLQGSWVPVYASGSSEDERYISTFDGPIDEKGYITVIQASKTDPDVKYEASIIFPGIRFFQKNGKDVFVLFNCGSPSDEIGVPLMYKFDNGRIYRELPVVINNSYKEGSGEFDKGASIVFIGDGQLKIGNVTYNKM